ncbi:hypothetical protein DRN63_04740 [Nanoarchaeota archaeon]|nr:MAG: hypothetical protein DRN63_04740 [Nanoarchaeota archaeon]
MVLLYLDTETLGTSIKDNKLIAIGVSTVNGDRKIWKEWELGERSIVEEFHNFLEKLNPEEQTVWIIGFNVLKFDIPLLLHKVVEFNMDATKYFELWHHCYIEDERQVLLPLNDFRFKNLKAERVYKALRKIFKDEISRGDIRVREIKYSSEEIPEFYKKREYDKIIEHLSSDLDFLEVLALHPDF